jgi:hypothetical protein
MMKSLRFTVSSASLTVALAVGLALLANRPAVSFQAADGAPTRWEYNTVTVEAASLQAKLGELATDGWEVFSLDDYESKVEGGDNNQPRLTVEKYQVTAKRPAR